MRRNPSIDVACEKLANEFPVTGSRPAEAARSAQAADLEADPKAFLERLPDYAKDYGAPGRFLPLAVARAAPLGGGWG